MASPQGFFLLGVLLILRIARNVFQIFLSKCQHFMSSLFVCNFCCCNKCRIFKYICFMQVWQIKNEGQEERKYIQDSIEEGKKSYLFKFSKLQNFFRSLKMWWLIGSAPDFWGRGRGFKSSISYNDPDALHDHIQCNNVEQIQVREGNPEAK